MGVAKINISQYIKPSYSFTEINQMMKLPLEAKEQITVEVIRQAIELSRHKMALAFSGGKDSEVVADIFERNFPEDFKRLHCIFGNTGIEFPESLRFARKYGTEHFGERFHETDLSKLEEPELKYEFARQIVDLLESENCLDEI